MIRHGRYLAGRVLLGLFFVFLSGCAGTSYLRTEEVDAAGIGGTFTLLLHGVRYGDDRQNVAILDREGDAYRFEIFAPAYDYRIRKDVPAEEAVREASRFVSSHYAFLRAQWSRILDHVGNIIGYEVRPLYQPLDTGYPDILDITYIIREQRVVVRIQFKPEIEQSITGERDFPIFRRVH